MAIKTFETEARPPIDAVAQMAQQSIAGGTEGGPSFFFLTTRSIRMDPELRADAERIMAENRALAWRNTLNSHELSLADQGLLIQEKLAARVKNPETGERQIPEVGGTIVTFNGGEREIQFQAVNHFKGTILIPANKESQLVHGETIAKPRTSAV